jgi:antirestriction protein ArdC
MPTPAQIRQQITDKIIAAIEGGTIVWKRPWSVSGNSGRPANMMSRRNYSGINVLLCELHRLRYGFSSRWFATFDQVKSLGGSIRKRPDDVPPGEWACHVVFFKKIDKLVTNQTTGEREVEHIPLLRTYTVFNLDQCEGVKLDRFRTDAVNPGGAEQEADFGPVEQIIDASGADIRYGGEQAYYVQPQPEGSWPNHRSGDHICVPERKRFVRLADFYGVVLHELAHHSEVRLGHDRKAHSYAFWELVAEMATCFICSELGVPGSEDDSNHVAYLKHWLNAMRGDSSFIFRASSMASKTADFLLAEVAPVAKAADSVGAALAS